jgi:glutathione S-transferase
VPTSAIDGTDGRSWHLPLAPLDSNSLEPWPGGDDPQRDRLEAALRLVGNHTAVVRFAARGCGQPGRRPVSAPLSDPTALPGEAHIPDVDAALRWVAHALITGCASDGTAFAKVAAAQSQAQQRRGDVAALGAAYMRDRVGVPRDMRFPAARQLRAHLNWFIDGVTPAV